MRIERFPTLLRCGLRNRWEELRSSLRLRLALTFAVGSLSALVAVTGFAYWSFRKEIYAGNLRDLEGRMQEVAAILHKKNHPGIEEEVLGEGAAANDPPVWLRVLQGGAVLVESRGMAAHLPDAAFRYGPRALIQGRHFLLEQRQVEGYRIQGGLDTTSDEELIEHYRHRLFEALVLGSSLCALVGWLAVHKGLQPIQSIEESTRAITANRLKERLEPAQVPRELRGLVRALNDMLDRLDQAFSRLSRFSADLAHELRTPITNLMGETEVALSTDRSAEEYRATLESSMEEFRRLTQLISRMLFLARTENLQTEVPREAVDPAILVAHTLAFFEAVAEEQGVRLEGSGTGRLQGDAGLLRQGLVNLVANALAATAPGDRIHVGIREAADGTESGSRTRAGGFPGTNCHTFWTGSTAPRRPWMTRPKAPAWGWRSSIPSLACTGARWRSKVSKAKVLTSACCCR